MTFWKWLLGGLDDGTVAASAPVSDEDIGSTVNPATGLPMLSGGMSGVDAGGSPYGMDLHSSTSRDSGSANGNEFDSAWD